jgi:hypothetical protein
MSNCTASRERDLISLLSPGGCGLVWVEAIDTLLVIWLESLEHGRLRPNDALCQVVRGNLVLLFLFLLCVLISVVSKIGGSYATTPHLAGRNWYQRNYPYAWNGARVVYDVGK